MKAPLAVIVFALAVLGAWPPRAVARMPDAPAAAVSGAMGTMAASDAARIMRRITAVGATKPPGAALDVRLGTTPHLDLASRLLDRRLRTAICVGC